MDKKRNKIRKRGRERKKKKEVAEKEIIRRRKSLFPADFFEPAHLGREREAIYYLTKKGIRLGGSERGRASLYYIISCYTPSVG